MLYRIMFNRIAISLAAFVLLAACQNTPNSSEGDAIPAGFQPISLSALDYAHMAPSANFGNYAAVLLLPLNFDSVEIEQISSARFPHTKDWELSDDDKVRLQKAFFEKMQEKLTSNSNFNLADTEGENTLQLEVFLTEIAPNAPRDDFESRPSARSRVYSEGFGDVSIRVEIRDSLSKTLLVTAADERKGDTTWRLNNRVTNWSEVSRMLRSWTQQISNGLDDLKAGQ